MTTKNHSNKDLLRAIDEFRRWNAEPWSLEWDTLMYFFEDACREYAIEKFYERGLSDEQAQDLVDSPRGHEYYIEYLDMYLNS